MVAKSAFHISYLIAVTQNGRRFVNESTSYHAFVEAMHRAEDAIPAFLICDATFLKTYGLGLVRPGPGSPKRYIDAGYLLTGNSIAELARVMASMRKISPPASRR